jgi:hypothetical protein
VSACTHVVPLHYYLSHPCHPLRFKLHGPCKPQPTGYDQLM